MFIPFHDKNPLDNVEFPWVNYGFIGLNVLVFLTLQQTVGVNEVAFSLGLIPAVVNDIRTLPPEAIWIDEQYSYLTYAFLHGGWMHLIGNMLFLWVFGDNIEDAMGHVKYFIFYILCAIFAGFAHSWVFSENTAPLVGASGAVSGVVGAYLILHPKVKVWVLVLMRVPLRLSAMWVLGFWVCWQVFQLVTSFGSSTSWIAHVAGIIAGMAMVFVLKKRHVPLFDRGVEY